MSPATASEHMVPTVVSKCLPQPGGSERYRDRISTVFCSTWAHIALVSSGLGSGSDLKAIAILLASCAKAELALPMSDLNRSWSKSAIACPFKGGLADWNSPTHVGCLGSGLGSWKRTKD